jgi:hypothetical protein
MIEIIVLRCAIEEKGITRFEERAGAGHGIGQILFLKFRKTLCFQNRYFAFVLHRFSFLPFI